jgi:hypothetical protein
MIRTYTDKDGTQIVLDTLGSEDWRNDDNDGVQNWGAAGQGYLIAIITPQTPQRAADKFIQLCKEHAEELLALERMLWLTPPRDRMKPSNALEKFKKRLCKEAGVIDS